MKTFSQRKGLKPVSETIQSDSMSMELRNSLWNALELALWSTPRYVVNSKGKPLIYHLGRRLWFIHLKLPIDTMPDHGQLILQDIRYRFFKWAWYEVYDFLEFVVDHHENEFIDLVILLNITLEKELSAYRFVSGQLTDITSEQELEMLDEALSDARFTGVAAHLQRSLELYSNRESPDYRNSIKESISAVEAMASILAEKPGTTLSDALKVLDKKGALHPALKEGFLKLYAYTCDGDGIRHAMLDEPNLDAADARYFLLSCTSFINYLKAQMG